MEETNPRTAGRQFEELLAIMARLRAPNGCPWDLKQTFDSIKPYTIEENYEVLDAIDARDWPGLTEELGDYLLQAAFYAQMAEEAGHFRMEDCLTAINEKLVRRHPHIYGTGTAETPEEVLKKWDEIKLGEKGDKAPKALLDGVPRSVPALMEASQLSAKAAKTGFDWPDVDSVLDKVREEMAELAEARAGDGDVEGELGDLLFSLVNVARKLKVDPEQALRKTNAKFRRRFGYVESSLAGAGRKLEEASLGEMEALWQQAKGQE